MRWSSATAMPRLPKRARGAAATGAAASTSSLPTSTSAVGATTTPLGTADTSQACPSLALVKSSLHVTVTGPVVSITPQEKVCTYKQNADSIVGIIVSFSQTTRAEFKAGEKN